jgi:hypothetical protein
VAENLFVIKIINRDSIPLRYWYRKKSGELFVCRVDKETGKYITWNDINDDFTYGNIDKEHAKVITEFEYEE